MRSWTHSTGFAVSTCASRKPAQPPSRGCAAKTSERVGVGGAGTRQRSSAPLGSARGSPGPERVETAPPATRDKPLATRLTTFLFYFCSFLVSRPTESMPRLGDRGSRLQAAAVRHCRTLPFRLGNERGDLCHDSLERRPVDGKAAM